MKSKFELEVHLDCRADLVIERGPDNKGVGKWVPGQKHVLLAKYIGAAREAMKKWPHLVFIDPFCGPGRIQVEGESFTRDGGVVVAWRQAAHYGTPYTKLLIGDLASDRSQACATRLRTLGAPVESFEGPAVRTITEMVSQVQKGSLCLAYLDPYNLKYLSFSIIQELAKLKNVDIAVHFSTMDLHRNIDFELDPDRARFDEVAPGWREKLQGTSKSALPVAFFNYWCGLIQNLGFQFSQEMPLIHNNTNHAIYRLVFFARHDLAKRLWGEVAKSKNMELDF